MMGAALLGMGCAPGEPEDASVNERLQFQEGGTAEMARVLEAIAEEARANPMAYYHLNNLRADHIYEQMQEAPEEERLQYRYSYAYELLYGGRTEEAIEEIQALIKDLGLSVYAINANNKALFDLLALAYLRLGEQQNCIENHTAEACILPLAEEAYHTKQMGSQRAATLLEQILQRFRSDLQSRWLLNLAYITLGAYPDEVPPLLRIGGLESTSEGNIPRFRNIAPSLGVAHDDLAGGVSVEDFNKDGFLDILVTSYGLEDQMRLYLADEEGGFVDATEEAGLKGLVSGLNTVHADFTNNGYEDVYVMRGAWLGEVGEHPNSLLRNNGDGTFTDVTYEAGLVGFHPSQVAAWADFDNDGWIDLFVGNESESKIDFLAGSSQDSVDIEHPSRLYRNNGDGTFTDVSEAVGVDVSAYVKGATWGDVNNDGLLDLFVAVMGGPNRLYLNQGGDSEEWQFEERAREAGVEEPHFAFPTWFWDYNNDGHEDLFVAGYDVRNLQRVAYDVAADWVGASVDAERSRIFRNNGDGTFTDVTEAAGLDVVTYPMGANFGDLDNDGYFDFYLGTGAPDLSALEPNRMFHNRSGERFEEVTFEGGFGHIQKGHGIAFADFNNDGNQDIYAVMGGVVEGDGFQNALFENPGSENNWITLELEGKTANRSAIGARIEVTARDAQGETQTFYRTVSTGGSFGATTLRQEIGLGRGEHIERLTVRWPNVERTTQTFEDIEVNQHLKVVEGEALAPLDREPIPYRTSDMASAHVHE